MSIIHIDTKDVDKLSRTMQNQLTEILRYIVEIRKTKNKVLRLAKHTDWKDAEAIYYITLECGHVVMQHELSRSQKYECKECKEEKDAKNI